VKRSAILLGILLLILPIGASTSSLLYAAGDGNVTVPADTVTIAVSVASSNENATLAALENAESLNRTLEALQGVGVKREEMLPGRSSSFMGSRSSIRICQRANNTTCEEVSSNDTKLVTTAWILLGTADGAIVEKVLQTAESQGASAHSKYSLRDERVAVDQACRRAEDDARSSAEFRASAEGEKLKREIDKIGPFFDILESDQPGMLDVISHVEIIYETEPAGTPRS
jgi:hypothetical protein